MILRDEDGVDWECTDIGGGSETVAIKRGTTSEAFRVLRCRPMDSPFAPPRVIRIPVGVNLEDPIVQHWVLWTARKHG